MKTCQASIEKVMIIKYKKNKQREQITKQMVKNYQTNKEAGEGRAEIQMSLSAAENPNRAHVPWN